MHNRLDSSIELLVDELHLEELQSVQELTNVIQTLRVDIVSDPWWRELGLELQSRLLSNLKLLSQLGLILLLILLVLQHSWNTIVLSLCFPGDQQSALLTWNFKLRADNLKMMVEVLL